MLEVMCRRGILMSSTRNWNHVGRRFRHIWRRKMGHISIHIHSRMMKSIGKRRWSSHGNVDHGHARMMTMRRHVSILYYLIPLRSFLTPLLLLLLDLVSLVRLTSGVVRWRSSIYHLIKTSSSILTSSKHREVGLEGLK